LLADRAPHDVRGVARTQRDDQRDGAAGIAGSESYRRETREGQGGNDDEAQPSAHALDSFAAISARTTSVSREFLPDRSAGPEGVARARASFAPRPTGPAGPSRLPPSLLRGR